MNDKQEGILFTIDCLNSHKYNFDYNLEELIKEAQEELKISKINVNCLGKRKTSGGYIWKYKESN